MFTVENIAKFIQGTIEGDSTIELLDVCDIKDGNKHSLTFLADPKYFHFIQDCKSSVVIVDDKFSEERGDKTLIRVQNAFLGYIKSLRLFHPEKPFTPEIHSSAVIDSNVFIPQSCGISPNVTIQEGVSIAENVFLGPGVVIGRDAKIGANSVIHANVTIYHNTIVGENVIIDSGTVVGSDGFGIVTEGTEHHKIPHLGKVVCQNDVWIGANCTIDRGTIGDTIIGESTKIDNQVHIAHNVKIGKGCLIAGQTGIAGSAIIGNYVFMSGHVGIVGHITVGDRCKIVAKSMVMQSLEPDSHVSGNPARPHSKMKRQDVVINQLPELLKRVRHLENKTKL